MIEPARYSPNRMEVMMEMPQPQRVALTDSERDARAGVEMVGFRNARDKLT